VDDGAEARDVKDGTRVIFGTPTSINTQACTAPDSPYVITYRTRDQANNEAVPITRQVHVVSPCPAPSFLCTDLDPPSCATCLDGGSCSCFTSVEATLTEETAIVEEYVPPEDVDPPVIELIVGDGQLGQLADGTIIVIDTVLIGDPYIHLGVTAHDELDGDLTDSVTASGLSAVDVHTATPANSPYVITYTVKDSAGNAAVPRRRRVVVLNPCSRGTVDNPTDVDELVCRILTTEDLEEGEKEYYCSTNQLCTTFELEEEEEEVVNEPPVMQLIGAAQVEVMQGESYIKCPATARLADVCDRGVTAVDPEEGDLTSMVKACSPDGRTGIFQNKGLQSCAINTLIPGVYPIVFEVADSKGLTVNVTRTLTVKSACPVGEQLCSDQVTCSSGGVCAEDLEAGTELVEEVVDQPPVIMLKAHPLLARYMNIKRKTPFAACAPGQEPTATVLCDLGANATDVEDGNLTSSIIVPTGTHSCLQYGCPNFKFVNKGIQGNVNMNAPVGTVFDITYYVFDSASPPHMVFVNRTVTIVSPCAEGENYCSDGEGDMVCSKITCAALEELRELLANKDTTPPVVTVVAGSLEMEYGTQALWNLQPCYSVAEFDPNLYDNCWAIAVDDVDGDVTPSITVEQLDTGGTLCDYQTVVTGTCLPGTYVYVYYATDAEGNNAIPGVTTIHVVALASTEFEMKFDSTKTSLAEATAEGEEYKTSGSSLNVITRQAVANMLNADVPVSDQTALDDVTILDVEVFDNGVGYEYYIFFSVAVKSTAATADEEEEEAVSRKYRSRAARRTLLQTSGIDSRLSNVAALLAAGAAGGVNDTNSLASQLAASAAASNVTLEVQPAGLSSEVASAVTSAEVDVIGALRSQIMGLIAQIKTSSLKTKAEVDLLETELPKLDDSYGGPDAMLLPLWQESMQVAGDNLGVLNEKTGEISENFDRQVAASDALLAGLESLIKLQQEQTEKASALESALASLTAGMLDAAQQVPPSEIGDITPPPPPEQVEEVLCEHRENGQANFYFSLEEIELMPSPPPPPQRSPPPASSPPPNPPPVPPPAWWAVPPPASEVESEEGGGEGGSRKLLKARSSGGPDEEEVVEEPFLGYVIPLATDIFRQEAQFTMDRFVSLKNKLVAGVELTVYSNQNSTCSKRFAGVGSPCNHGAMTDGRYGMDPVFFEHADLFRPELEDKVERYYNATSPESEEVDCKQTDGGPFNVRTCKPKPFYHPHSKMTPGGSPVFVDAGVTGYRMREIFTLMREGGYIPKGATQLVLEMVTFNAHLQIFSLVRMVWKTNYGGAFVPTYEIKLIAMRRWPELGDWSAPKNADEFNAMFILCMYLLWALIIYVRLFNDTRKRMLSMRRVPKGERSLGNMIHAFFKYERRVNALWSMIDLIAVWVQFACLFLFAYKEWLCWTEVAKLQGSYEIYDGRYGGANYLMPRKLDSAFEDPATLTKYRWELPNDPTSADKYATDISVLKHATDLEFRFWSLEAIALTLVGVRFLKDFDFQPRLAFMNNTFRICASELAHFLFVLLFMLTMNGLVLHLTIGTFISRCSTMWGSFVYSSEVIASGFLDTNELYPHTTMWTGMQWFPVYLGMYVIPVVILWAALNFLLAIIGDAYAEVKEEASTSKTLYAEGLEFLGYWILAKGYPAADLNVQYRIMCNAGVPINQTEELDSESGMSSGEKQRLRDTYNATLNGLIAG
jgi:hypothetical protein